MHRLRAAVSAQAPVRTFALKGPCGESDGPGVSIVPFLLFAMLAAPALALLRRAGRGPGIERLVALFLLLLGLGMALRLHAVGDGGRVDPVANAAGHVALSGAVLFLYRFTRVVFRPDALWARRLELVGAGGTLATLGVLALDGGYSDETAASILAANAFRALSCGWSFAEALRYRRSMQRRAALGLGDPLVANRFLLWSLWMGSLTLSLAFVLAMRVAAHASGPALESMVPALLPIVRGVMAATSGAALVALWLTFFPPPAYQRWAGNVAR